jgi:glycosyltransferase involved in cell wall biosynthesis
MLPVHFLPKAYALITDVLSEETLKEGWDIVYINRFIPAIHISVLEDFKERYGFKLVIDIDDYWHLDQWHILKDVYPTQAVIDHIKIADLVTTTTERLWNEIRLINSNVAIVPNALPYGEDQFTDVVTNSDKVRFIYAGSITHEKDLQLLQNPLKKVASDSVLKSKVHFRLCGFDNPNRYSEAVWHKMIHYFTCGLKLGDIERNKKVTEYMNFYNNADATIVPLVHSKFNSMKSNLKILEAACKKIPVIISNVPPYDDAPHVIKIDKQNEWYPAIKKITDDAIYRKELGEANYEWCNEHFNLHKVNILRKQLFESICQ